FSNIVSCSFSLELRHLPSFPTRRSSDLVCHSSCHRLCIADDQGCQTLSDPHRQPLRHQGKSKQTHYCHLFCDASVIFLCHGNHRYPRLVWRFYGGSPYA